MRLSRAFFERETPKVARDLIGCRIVRVVEGETLSGFIVETEAYRGARDPASHAYRGRTPRNEVMYGEAGHAYVYFVYGFHYCLNVTTEPVGRPGAVLIRAMEPEEGAQTMARNRGGRDVEHVADGPGKLTQALRIDRKLNGEDLVTSGRLFLNEGRAELHVAAGPRVGVRDGQNFRWRFYASDNPFVSHVNRASKRGTHN